jgi:hypothetical protein
VLVLLSQKDVQWGQRREFAVRSVTIRFSQEWGDWFLLVISMTPVAH